MNIQLGYGYEKLNVFLPEEQVIAVLKPNSVQVEFTGEEFSLFQNFLQTL